MKKKLVVIGAISLILALLLTLAPACGDGDEEPGFTPTPGRTPTPGVTPGATPTPTGEVKTLKIGIIAPLSGPAAAWGNQLELGTKFAASDFNAAGGIKVGADTYMIETVSCDGKFTGSVVANCATEMAYEHKVKYVVGPIAGMAEPPLPILTENKIISVSCTGEVFCEYPYNFAAGGPPSWSPNFYAEFHKHHPDVKTVAIVTQEDPNSRTFYDNTVPVLPELGIELIATKWYTFGTTDFYPVLTEIVAKNPDAIETGGGGPGDQALIMKQARELGFTGWFLNWAWIPAELLQDIVGLEYMYKVATTLPDYSAEYWSPQLRELNVRYMAEGWYQPGEAGLPDCVLHGYSYVTQMVTAIEIAGTIDTDEVLKVMDDPNFTFERYYVPNAKIGGVEYAGCRRWVPHNVPYSEIIDGKAVQLGGAVCAVP